MAKKTDTFANKFYGKVIESAANTLTFAEIPTNVDVFSKRAWVLHKLEWYLSGSMTGIMNSNGDQVQVGLCSSDKASALSLDDSGVIDLLTYKMELASAVGLFIKEEPLIRDFNNMPGGGLIIAPRPLYIAVKGTGAASAVTAEVRGYFTAVDLNADEYLELVDFYRIVQ